MQSISQEVSRAPFSINLNDERLQLIHALAKFLVRENFRSPMKLDTRPLGENDDNDIPTASKWTTVATQNANQTGRWQNVSVSIDLRFKDCNASFTEEFNFSGWEEQIVTAMKVVQIQKFVSMGGVWSIDARVSSDIAVPGKEDARMEMRIFARDIEDLKGGRRMV